MDRQSREFSRGKLTRFWRSIVVLGGHLAVAMLTLSSLKVLELFLDWTFGRDGLVLFANSRFEFPAKWIFEAASIGVLLVFIFWAVVETAKELRDREHE
jgi:hypothetical protein